MIKAKRDVINAVLILVFSGVLYYQIQVIPESTMRATGAAFFPKIVIPVLGLLGLCLLIVSLRRMLTEPNQRLLLNPKVLYRDNYKIVWVFVICAAYVLALQYVGFIISTPLFLIGVYLLLANKIRKPWLMVAGYILLTAVIYVVFQWVLFVFLPAGQLL